MKRTSIFTRIAIAAIVLSVLGAGVALAQGRWGGFGMHGGDRPGFFGTSDDNSGRAPFRGMMGMHSRWDGFEASEAEYLAHMIPHHEEAIEAATELRSITEREEMRSLADSIIAEQRAEIELMSAWLDELHPDAAVDVDYEPMMRSLEGLDPDEADRVFIEDMIPHHMMAVRNSNMLLHHGIAEHEEVADLARSIVDSQHAEMAQMAGWYSEWFADSRGFGPGGRRGSFGHMGSPGHMGRWGDFDRADEERSGRPRSTRGMHGRR